MPKHQPAAPFVFVVPELPGTSLAALRRFDVSRDWHHFVRGPWIWCHQTYLELKRRGWPVVLAHQPAADSVNVVHVRTLYELDLRPDKFIVSIQADCPDVAPWTPVNLVQNRRQADAKRSYWIPHWPQPGLIPRSPDRTQVRCAGYAGHTDWMAGTEHQWRKRLAALGIEFRLLGDDCWNDYSEVDVLLAMRSFDRRRYNFKPPTKLINAWQGRVPLIAGYDSAFSQIGTPGRDYLRAASWAQALDAIRTLRDDPDRYCDIVDAGTQREREYTRDRIAEAWMQVLGGPVMDHFRRWKKP